MPSPVAPIIVARHAFDNTPTASGLSNATVADDTTNFKSGVKSTRITRTGAGSFTSAEFRSLFTSFTFTPSHQIKVRVYTPYVIDRLAVVMCRSGGASTADDQAAQTAWFLNNNLPIPSGWHEFYLSIRPHAQYSHASGGIANFTGLGFYFYSDTPLNDYITLDLVEVCQRGANSAVFTHTSDDGFADQQYRNMANVLDKYNFRTTDACITGIVGTGTAASGYMSWTQQQEMARRSHFPNNHSANGHDTPTFFNGKPHDQRLGLMRSGYEAMLTNELSPMAGVFTFPLGLGNGCEWTEEQVNDLYQYASCFLDTSTRGWPRVPRPTLRIRTDNTLNVGTLVRGTTIRETSGGAATGVTATFSHYGNASGANTYIHLILNSTGVPVAASGAVWTDGTNSVTTNEAGNTGSSNYGIGRTAQPIADGAGAAGAVYSYQSAQWYPDWMFRDRADYASVSTTGTNCIKYDDFDNSVNWTWDNAAKTLTAGSGTPLSAYTYQSGDLIYISSGTGFTAGWYSVASKASSTQITLGVDPHTGVTANIANTADVRVLSMVNGGSALRAITRGAIHLAVARRAFCCLLTHRVLNDADSYDGTHMKISDLDRNMGYLRSLIDAGSATFYTVAELCHLNGINPSAPAVQNLATGRLSSRRT